MIIIAHRGNINGPSKYENMPIYLEKAISLGFDVETDVWLVKNKLYLGHDMPQYPIDINFLLSYKESLWLHAKNIEALQFLLDNKLHVFWHENDKYTLTSKGIVWAYPEQKSNGIYVMPENIKIPHNAMGVCTDYCYKYISKLRGASIMFQEMV